MSPTDTLHLGNFLKLTEAERLGEGDVVAGANLLAAMTISLANIQRPGSGLVASSGETIGVGASCIISGSLSASLVGERVLTGLGEFQNNLINRLGRICDGTGHRACHIVRADDWEEAIFDSLCRNQSPTVTDEEARELWARILKTPAQGEFRDLLQRPMVFTTASTPARLAGQVERSHMGRPFLHLGVGSAADLSRFGSAGCQALIEGRLTVGPNEEIIRGAVVLTDRGGALDEAVQSDLPGARWVSRMLWLVDGNTGPDLGDLDEAETATPIGDIGRHYAAAMGAAWGQRIGNRTDGPVMLDVEFTAQAHWIDFLQSNEKDFPGLTGALRNFYATLVFGFHQMFNTLGVPTGFTWHHGQVKEFAMFLVHRMVNARAVMMRSADLARKRQLGMEILGRLVDGPRELRDIGRSFHRLKTGECLDVMRGLQDAGSVVYNEKGWGLAHPCERTDSNARDLILET